ncbi:hypothetical protein [Caloranaerobacter azorensis]|uniref:Uncharacterized protein n=1 Tax=Caloranaerobacter azorensis TaxID=116090 RepID=A0A6P1YDC9_9FIRM|nr:hypothetical protein [Caloranaerobacter azorensis]QIB27077.1 hypothetical protein G3A45_07110 [Caloranaerobacter azorensis]
MIANILYYLIKIFLWGLALFLSIIPGMIAGYIGETLLGGIGYWIGFVIGILIFLVYMKPLLAFDDDKPLEKEYYQQSYGTSLFSFLVGIWLGRKFFGKDD